MSKLHAAITAVGAYVPEYVLTNQILETMVDTNDEWITSRTGIKERRILKDAGKGTSYLAINAANNLIEKGLIDDPPHFQLCMGVKWGIEASPENLLFMKSKLPPDALWSVLGVGKAQLPMITMAILLGGNVRVGFEDNIYLEKGVLASNNAQTVEMAVDLCQRLGGEVATPAEARRILGIKNAG